MDSSGYKYIVVVLMFTCQVIDKYRGEHMAENLAETFGDVVYEDWPEKTTMME